jgi:two-component system cell cycle response regulator
MSDNINNSVLLVEDSPIYERIITGHLRNWGFEVKTAHDGEEALALLQEPNSPRLVIMDWVMPKMDGVELCRRLRKLPSAFPYTYTLLLTGKDSRADLLKAMEAGVDDYLAKPFDDLELKARLLAGKRVIDLQNQLLAARESLRYAASYDHLTGLMNRKEVMEVLQRELARAKRDHSPVTVAMIDVDHFKKVNDELGHLFGDAALKEVARRFQSQLRVYDSIGRVGGEELLLVFPGCDLTSALIRMDQIRGLVCKTPVTAMGKSRLISVSIGVAVADGQKVMEVNDLLHQADMGLYEAKKSGRNRVEHVEYFTESQELLAVGVGQ